MQDDIRTAIEELQAAFSESEADGVVTEEERAELREMVGRLNALLEEPDDHENVVDQVERVAVGFQERHPGIARVARGIVETLSNYGI